MNGVVDRIYTYSEDNQIWGIPTICSSNGIDFDLVSIRKVEKKRESINLIAVAGLAKWHGYDRILRGMGEYYKEGCPKFDYPQNMYKSCPQPRSS